MGTRASARRAALVVTASYLAAGGLWIRFSDAFLERLLSESDASTLTRLQTYKGWLFIAVTAALLYWLVRRAVGAVEEKDAALLRQNDRMIAETHRNADVLEEKVQERTRALSQANARLEEADRHKSLFLSSMSHELRTPLNSILGFSDLLKGKFFGPLNEKQESYVDHIDSSGRRLLALINDLLDIARIDAGAMELRAERFGALEILQETLDSLRPQIGKKRLEVENRSDPDVGSIRADRRKFKQIAFNLLSNAIKFSPEGGRIGLAISREGQSTVLLKVADSGPGIEREEQEKIFGEFYQTRSARDSVLGGAGIGLALTRRLVELHSGEIGVHSQLGQGSEFWARFPQPPEPALETPKPRPVPSDGRMARSRILVAEDNDANLTMLLDMLSIWEHTVYVARNGQEAIDLAQTHNPDIILLDVLMPVLDGLEAVRRLRASERFQATPIIALTASVGPDAVQTCLEAGFTAHVAKPIQTTDLFAILEKHLAGAGVAPGEKAS